MTKIYLNNKLVDLTTEQEIKRLAEIEQNKKIKEIKIAIKTAEETKKASAKEKLLALGLTEEEIKLTFGI